MLARSRIRWQNPANGGLVFPAPTRILFSLFPAYRMVGKAAIAVQGRVQGFLMLRGDEVVELILLHIQLEKDMMIINSFP